MRNLCEKGALTNWDNTNSLKRNSDKHRCEECGKQPRTMRDSEGRCLECQGLIPENHQGDFKVRHPIKVNYERDFETDHPAAEDEDGADRTGPESIEGEDVDLSDRVLA